VVDLIGSFFPPPSQRATVAPNVPEGFLPSLTRRSLSLLPSSSPAMDKAILSLTAQKIRELFTICGIEDSEEHLNLVIAHAADHGELAPANV
jgi:hypothetical protein